MTDLARLGAADAARLIGEGRVTAEEVMAACLAQAREAEPRVQAWAFLDPEHALEQARAADQWRALGRPLGPLHGVPVGMQDLFDTADMPTERGSVLYAGRTPSRDAAAAARLRAAGAVVMGKTATTELGSTGASRTRNPHDPARTAGGSSSGSAAAVGAHMAPAALASQTGASTILSASYCGVYGLKPTHGLISRHGLLPLSRTLDHVGVLARSLEDLALLMEVLPGHDERDPDTRPRARVPYRALAAAEPPIPPMLGLVRTRHWDRLAEDAREALGELEERLGAQVEELELSAAADEAAGWHASIMAAEMAQSRRRERDAGRDGLSETLRAQLERGREVRAAEYLEALDAIPALRASFAELFEQRYDALVTPAVPSTAPGVDDWTNAPVFATLWTLCGMPALSVPLMQGADGLPLGVQLVGPRHGDARLLRTARWLVAQVAGASPAV